MSSEELMLIQIIKDHPSHFSDRKRLPWSIEEEVDISLFSFHLQKIFMTLPLEKVYKITLKK